MTGASDDEKFGRLLEALGPYLERVVIVAAGRIGCSGIIRSRSRCPMLRMLRTLRARRIER